MGVEKVRKTKHWLVEERSSAALSITKITSQLPLFATYLVFTVHNIISHYMFRLYSHLQVCHVYKNAKIILKLNGSVNLVSK
jgi:hypothetical protein